MFERMMFPLFGKTEVTEQRIIIEHSNKKQILVYFHGNAETILTSREEATKISKCFSATVILVEYYGYYNSKSKKDPDILDICRDAERQLNEIKQEFSGSQIILVGRSIGTGVVGYLASKNSYKIILITPLAKINSEFFIPEDFKHIGALFKNYSPNFFDNIAVVKNLKSPILIVAAIDDEILPIKHTNALVKANSKIEVIYVNSGHNDFSLTDSELIDEIKEFLED